MFANSTVTKILKINFLHPTRVYFFIFQWCHLTSLQIKSFFFNLKGIRKITRCYSQIKYMFPEIIFAQSLNLWVLLIKWYCTAVSFMHCILKCPGKDNTVKYSKKAQYKLILNLKKVNFLNLFFFSLKLKLSLLLDMFLLIMSQHKTLEEHLHIILLISKCKKPEMSI